MGRARRAGGEPVVEEGADTVRLRILRGAAAAFGRKGYGATSVEVILAEARVSRRTFYKVFRSKDDVLRVLFENSVAHRRERLTAAVEAYVQVHARAGPLARVLLLEQFSPNSPLAKQRQTAMTAFTALLSDAFAREGRERPDPILAHGVVAAINQIAVQMATEYPAGGWDIDRAKRAMLRILVALDERAAAEPMAAPARRRSARKA